MTLLMNAIIERASKTEELRRKDPSLSVKLKLDKDCLPSVRDGLIRSDCQKFFMSDATLQALRSLSTEDCLKATELIRPCFESMWVEYNFDKSRKVKAGFFLHLIKDSNALRICYLQYCDLNQRFQACETVLNATEMYEDFCTVGELPRLIPEVCGGDDNTPRLRTHTGVDIFENYIIPMLFRILILLNTPKLTEVTESEDFIAINKKRVRQSKPPLVTYRIVDLSKDMKRRIRESEEHEKLHGKAFHYVRGHFKYLSRANVPGLYWWSPHTAGSKEFGTVHKAYVHGKPPDEGETTH